MVSPKILQSLITASELASELGNTRLAAAYLSNATALKSDFNSLLWDDAAGMFRDNDISTLHPQDGNSLAILFNVTHSAAQNQAISKGLTTFWTDIGPLSPELNDTIIPFVGGFEVREAPENLYLCDSNETTGSSTLHRRPGGACIGSIAQR